MPISGHSPGPAIDPFLLFPKSSENGPSDAHLLGAEPKVRAPNGLAQMVQNLGGLKRKNERLHSSFKTVHSHRVLGAQPSCKPPAGRTHDQLMEQRRVYGAGFAPYIALWRK